ncbi:amidohydrolase family protein [Flavobacterium sp. UBA6135]|uniref:amidohydrolase family protein n=1 Tax=Flavobacterium sp. UBA6135 TaxID=1946553 RepID=UPI0025C08FB2|nr:amidohydrolase family protein [Flavobacterium sp. UBA6135]
MRNFIHVFFILFVIPLFAQDYFPKNDGVRQNFKSKIAITNATVYVSPTQKLEKATILLEGDRIVEIGTNITIPKNVTVIDATGKTIYSSFIDLYSEFGMAKPPATPRGGGMNATSYEPSRQGYYWNDHIKPEYQAFENVTYDAKSAAGLREIGFGTVVSHNSDGIIAGTGLLWTLNDADNNATRILNQKVSQHFTFRRSRNSRQAYPSSLMGSMALLRQVYHDAEWYEKGNSKTVDLSLDAFNQNKKLLQIFNAGDKLNALRAATIGKEFGVNYLIKGSGNEFERIEEIKKTGATYIIPLEFPEAYDVSNSFLAYQVSLTDMKFWNQAPFNLKILAENNVNFILTASDLKNQKEFLTQLRKAVAYGLPKEKALAALTTIPAQLLNQSANLGSLKKGSLANFIITSGDLFESKTILHENWVQGNRTILSKFDGLDSRGTYDLVINQINYELKIEGEAAKPEAKITKDSISFDTKTQFNDPWINLLVKSKDTTAKGYMRLNGVFDNAAFKGTATLEDGSVIPWSAKLKEPNKVKEKPTEEIVVPEMVPIAYPNVAFGNKEKPKQETLLFKNATVWTGESEGILKETDVLIQNGKIIRIGKNISGANAKTIDATGKHLTAGIIDEHSHIAISSGVNEGGQNSSAEVTIEDVINSEDINIYRNLSGGVTSANLLHGSANPIGGRAAFIKLKWGYSPEEMLVKEAPKYIKFALGENVKQSNWGTGGSRFPQSRMGVEQVYEDYFTQALAYEKEWKTYNASKSKTKIKPRYDIEMEVLVEILNKKRFITCHSYVQSEINMLMKLADRYQFKIQTFTHILEGYKVADKMAAHGVGGSTFSDWWGYKFEVKDAIPHNAALMQGEGVLVSINSDDAEMSRRLNQEAAKTVKYGNVSEEEAWNFVTLNPARLLQVDNRLGSIKVGKDADVVLWSESPLSIYAKVEKTIIDGIVFYDLEQSEAIIENIQKERNLMINQLLDAKNKGSKTQTPKRREVKHYHCDTLLEEF